MSDLVSVIIPVFNVKEYLEKCIRSVLDQSYEDLEIIIVDDGSTDGSSILCDRFPELDHRVKVIHKVNGGLSDARNAGINVASGKYFMFVDSDDTIKAETIEVMYNALRRNDCDIAVCNMLRINDKGETSEFYCPTGKEQVLCGEKRFETLKQPSACNKLFKAELFSDVRFPVGKFYEDTFVYHVLAYKAASIVLTGFDGYYYLIRDNSILGAPKYTNRYFDFVEAVYHRAVFLADKGVKYYAEEACLSLYAATSSAISNIPVNRSNQDQFKKVSIWYDFAFKYLMTECKTSRKQRIRLVLLRYIPSLHKRLYKR